jgi:selenocysteine lyase/cysteine desulfurase
VGDENVPRQSLGEQAAFQLANATKAAPQYGAITPRSASLALYNTCEDIDSLVGALRRLESGRRHRNP